MNLGKYEIDNIYNDDSYNSIKDIPDKCIDLIVIDPPYLSDANGGGCFGKSKRKYHNETMNLKNGINEDILNQIVRVMKKINLYIFCNKEQLLFYLSYFVNNKKCLFDLLMWHKNNPIPTCNNKYLSDTEYILYFREKGVKLYGTYKTKSKYFITSKNLIDKKLYNHPTIKPLSIIETLIYNSSNENDLIADFFMGSGTTAVACINLKRHFIGFEINKEYFNNAKKRIQRSKENEK